MKDTIIELGWWIKGIVIAAIFVVVLWFVLFLIGVGVFTILNHVAKT